MSKLPIDEGTLAIIRVTAEEVSQRTAERMLASHQSACPLRDRVLVLEQDSRTSSTWGQRAWTLIIAVGASVASLFIGKHWGK